MSNSKVFKVGDFVYAPIHGNNVFVLKPNGECLDVCKMDGISCVDTVNTSGIAYNDLAQCIFHATKENQKVLDFLYNDTFDSPISELDYLLNQNKLVLCYVGSNEATVHVEKNIKIISSVVCVNHKQLYKAIDGGVWSVAIPVKDTIRFTTG